MLALFFTASLNASELEIELLAMDRDAPDGTNITGPDDVGDDFLLVEPDDVDPGTTGGIRVNFKTEISGRNFIFSGFWMDPFHEKGLFGDGNAGVLETNMTYDNDAHLNPGSDVGSTQNSDDIEWLHLEHKTELYGAEANYIIPLRNKTSLDQQFYVGLRGLYFGEELDATAYDELNDLQGTDNDIDRTEIETTNKLLGIQIGVEGKKAITSKVGFEWDAKYGIYANLVERDRSFSRDDSATDRFSDNIDDTNVAQVLEINPKLNVMLSKNAILTFGGTIMYIHGVSEAGDHFATLTDFQDRKIRDDGEVLFYGLSAGLKVNF